MADTETGISPDAEPQTPNNETQIVQNPSSSKADLTSDGKNSKSIKCLRCPSTILIPEMATLVLSEFVLPAYVKKTNVEGEQETLRDETKQYWCVDNMYTFENIGFSKTVDGVKYLICADCEIGPIGFHDLESKLSYVSLGRVQCS